MATHIDTHTWKWIRKQVT